MTMDQLLGLGILLMGAICGGSFGLPSKYVKEDTPWEVLWGPFFFFVTILIPCVVAPLVVDDLGGVYASVDTNMIIGTLLFGFLWGLGSMTLGMSFSFIGLSLAYAINYGAQIACGFTLPMLLFNADQFLTTHGAVILAGVAVCLVGVVVCGRAGILKERDLAAAASSEAETTINAPAEDEPAEETSAQKNPKMIIGLVIAFMSGILCACYAVAAAFAGAIGGAAVEAGNPQWAAAWASTAMILWGGAISACLILCCATDEKQDVEPPNAARHRPDSADGRRDGHPARRRHLLLRVWRHALGESRNRRRISHLHVLCDHRRQRARLSNG
jgi:L-rhamnose-H+ transport protein